MTPEEKEQNKNYILANLNNYIIDGHDNFIHTKLQLGEDYYYIENYKVNDFEEVEKKLIDNILKDRKRWSLISRGDILQEIFEAILKEKDQWKIVYRFGDISLVSYEHVSGEKLKDWDFNWDQNYILKGELGHKESIWKD